MIPNEIIDRILDKIDIVEVISGYVQLKKAGQNFKAPCPFHKEKTPSFMVSPSKQIYHCFGCGAGGNAVGFLMKYEAMDFIEAIKTLADKAGVTLPRATGQEGRAKNTLADKLFEVNAFTSALYQENLKKEIGEKASRYLTQRGVQERTTRHFRLGFAEDLWQGLINYCKANGIGTDILEKAGLILQNAETKNLYDRFRNRVMFPIFDLRHRIIGFGGRAMGEVMPKYMNSPETHVYTKGRQLYGLNFSREYIKKQGYVIIVEGYFDLILPFQNDIRNIVATLGTALTVEQTAALKRLTKNAIMVYDSDKAGQEATLRGIELLIEEEMNVRIAILPKGTDPDSFVRKEDRTGFMKILKDSKDFFDYKLGTLIERFRKDTPHGKARIVEEMLPTLVRVKNAVLRSGYLKKMAEELSVDEESIRAELKRLRPDRKRFYAPPPAAETAEKKVAASFAEMMLLAMVLDDNKYVKRVDEELGFAKLKDRSVVAILEKVRDSYKNGREVAPSHLISYFEDNRTEETISKALSLTATIQDRPKAMNDCFRHIRRDNLKAALHSIQFKIKEAENSADRNRVKKLVSEYNELMRGFKD